MMWQAVVGRFDGPTTGGRACQHGGGGGEKSSEEGKKKKNEIVEEWRLLAKVTRPVQRDVEKGRRSSDRTRSLEGQ
jgi:hypothetical protein